MDKVVPITGASSGIGAGIAREPASAGAKAMAGARRAGYLKDLVAEARRSCRAVALVRLTAAAR